MEDTNRFLNDLGRHTRAIQNALKSLDENHRVSGIPEYDGAKTGHLHAFFEKHPQGSGHYDVIESFINETIKTAKQIEEFRTKTNYAWEVEKIRIADRQASELAHEKAKRKAERWDTWKLWLQQTIRWVLGVILVILLYSGAVAVHNDLLP